MRLLLLRWPADSDSGGSLDADQYGISLPEERVKIIAKLGPTHDPRSTISLSGAINGPDDGLRAARYIDFDVCAMRTEVAIHVDRNVEEALPVVRRVQHQSERR